MPWTDEQLDRAIGTLLRTGVSTAGVIVLSGFAWLLVRRDWVVPSYRVFHGEPAELRSVSSVLKGVLAGHVLSWIQFGILLLIATPVARVAFSLFAFAAQRDWMYVTMTLIVLAILLYSLAGGGL